MRNQKYLEKAAKSVEEHHNYRCNRSDFYDAAEIVLLTISLLDEMVLDMPLWDKQKALKEWE